LFFIYIISCKADLGYHYPKIHKGNTVPASGAMPLPWVRELSLKKPYLQGNDVYLLQNLLSRSPFCPQVSISSAYDINTNEAVIAFQTGNKIPVTGSFDSNTANTLLSLHSNDQYKDNGRYPSGDYLYKVYIPVHKNRSVETTGTLFSRNMTIMHKFTTRTHGINNPNTGDALNQFTTDGMTPTGLMTFDLNSPEDDPKSFGPYPVNRCVTGLAGNAKVLIYKMRDGILMHTGEWDGWDPSKPMPNSHGCIHAHPDDIKQIWQILISLGVVVHQNTDGKRPYPYKPQGIISIEQID